MVDLRHGAVWALCLAAAGCGRLGFESRPPPDAGRQPPGDAGPGPGPEGGVLDAGTNAFCARPGGLVGCWRLDGDGADDSGAGRDLDLRGADFVDGRGAGVLSLREDSEVVVTGGAPIDFGAGFSLELFVRVPALPAARAGLVDKQEQFGFFLQPDGDLTCTGGDAAARCAALVPGRWTHVACTLRGSRIEVYLDGARCAEAPADPVADGDAPLRVGEDSPDGGDQLVGLVDDLQIFARGRSPAGICTAAGGDDC